MEWFKNLQATDFLLPMMVILLSVLIFFRLRRGNIQKFPLRFRMGGYVLIYADQKQDGNGKEQFGKVLFSEKYGLRGKPDYVFRRRLGRSIVPVEVKSGKIGDDTFPHQGDLLQLCAYFLLLEDVYDVRPKFGWLEYQDYMFFVRNTARARKEVLRTMRRMREMLQNGNGEAKADFATCRYCVCNGTVCPYAKNGLMEE